MAECCSRPEWCPLLVFSKIGGHSTWAYVCEDQHLCSLEIPTLVGPKGVYCWPRVCEFLHFISNFAVHIVIWSSMKRATVEQVACYLFHGLSPSFAILGQNQCTNIEIGDGQFVLNLNENKFIFLKIMLQQLISVVVVSWPFSNNNTILIDDSLEKSVCNKSGNAIFLSLWVIHLHVKRTFLELRRRERRRM